MFEMQDGVSVEIATSHTYFAAQLLSKMMNCGWFCRMYVSAMEQGGGCDADPADVEMERQLEAAALINKLLCILKL